MFENKNERYLWCFSNVSYEIDRKFWKNGSTFTSLLQFIYLSYKNSFKKRNSLCPFVQNRHKKILKYRLTFNNSNLLLRKSNTFNSLKNSACKKQKITKEKITAHIFLVHLEYLPVHIDWLAEGRSIEETPLPGARTLRVEGTVLRILRVVCCTWSRGLSWRAALAPRSPQTGANYVWRKRRVKVISYKLVGFYFFVNLQF